MHAHFKKTTYRRKGGTSNTCLRFFRTQWVLKLLCFLWPWCFFQTGLALQRQNAENLKQIFPEKEYRGLSPNFYIHVSVSELYIPTMGLSLFCWRKYVDLSGEFINRSKTHECGNWGWGRAIPRKGIYNRNCRCSEYRTPFTFVWRLFLLWVKMLRRAFLPNTEQKSAFL